MDSLKIYYLQVAFISLVVINHLFEIYLIRRQLGTFQKHLPSLPEEFKGFLTFEDHQKAIHYSSAKLQLSTWHLLFDAAVLLCWFPFKGAEKLYLGINLEGIHQAVFFLLAFSSIQFILGLPWSIYSTFVLEEKYGFNRSTPKIFVMDRFKGIVLGAIIGIPMLYGIILIFNGAGSWWWLVSFAVLTGFQFLLVWIYPTVIAPLFNKFHPLEGEELKGGIEKLVTSAGFGSRGVFVMDASKRSSHGNAYFTGFGKNKRVVFFDTLLKGLQDREILAILAHELGHLKLKHIPKSLVASLVISFIGFWFMGQVADKNWFYSGHFIRIASPGVLILLFTQAIPLYTFWFSPISTWISRKREFEADAYAAQETQASDLINGLLKLYQQNASPVVTDEVYSFFYHSHPPALERIKRLESLEGKPSERLS